MKETKKQPKPKFRKKEFEIKFLSDGAAMPVKAVNGAIGYDLCVPRDFHVPAHSRVAVPLDIAINLPRGIEAKIEPRSGCSLRGMEGYGTRKVRVGKFLGIFHRKKTISCKQYFDADVLVGKIDPNYTDNIHIILNNRDEAFLIRKGTRIAQLTFYQTIAPFFKEVEQLSCKSRGGGLGHTGTDRLLRLNDTLGLAESLPGPSSHLTHTPAREKLRRVLARRKVSECDSQSDSVPIQVSTNAQEGKAPLNNEEDTDPKSVEVPEDEVDALPSISNDSDNDIDSDNYGVHV